MRLQINTRGFWNLRSVTESGRGCGRVFRTSASSERWRRWSCGAPDLDRRMIRFFFLLIVTSTRIDTHQCRFPLKCKGYRLSTYRSTKPNYHAQACISGFGVASPNLALSRQKQPTLNGSTSNLKMSSSSAEKTCALRLHVHYRVQEMLACSRK